MLISDSTKLAMGAISSQRMRSFLTALGIAVGIASVVLLTSIGEGIHQFVLSEFTQFGTNLIAIAPGKTTTLTVGYPEFNTAAPPITGEERRYLYGGI